MRSRTPLRVTRTDLVTSFVSSHPGSSGSRFGSLSPLGFLARYAYYREAVAVIENTHSRLANFRFKPVPRDAQRQAVVLVIGESARADRWGVNGYPRPTSPELSSMGNLVTLGDAVSVAAATRLSVPIILTRKPADLAESYAFPERSVISLFKEAGFHTAWLSNQALVGQFDTPISVYAKEADEVRFLNPSSYKGQTPYDEVLLQPLKQVLASQHDAVFVVVHTLGSHFNYRHRYPADFDRFQPSPRQDDPVSLHDKRWKEALSNAYDNSILYADHVLGEVVDALRASGRERALMLYVSDHGEDLFDNRCQHSGHGRGTPNGFRVPYFVWYSDAYAARFPEKIEALHANRQKQLTTETVFESLADAAAIQFPTQDVSRSVLSDAYRERQRRVLTAAGLVNFDAAAVGSACELSK